MAAVKIHVHPQAAAGFKPINELVPILDIRAVDTPGGNGQAVEVQLHGLTFTDPDGEIHIYLFNEEGRQDLIRQLTGGIVIPG